MLSEDPDDDLQRFPRQVAYFGGASPKCIPDYVKRLAVASVTSLSLGDLEQHISKPDLECMFLWAIDRSAKTPIPERRQTHSAFLAWYKNEVELYCN
eukprot:9708136-Lingulodinium_polyedra.AAC.1